MPKSLSELSKKLINPARKFISTENVEKTAEFSKSFMELAKTLQEQGKSIGFLMGLVKESSPLLSKGISRRATFIIYANSNAS